MANLIPKSPQGRVFVKIDKRFLDEMITPGGVKLYLDVSWKPEWYVCISGTVVSVPLHTGLKFENKGIPSNVVNVGDKIYFSYQVALKRDRVFDIPQENGTIDSFWAVDLFHIWCIVRDGKIIAMPGKAIVLPDKKTLDEKTAGGIYIPDSHRKKQSKKTGTLRSIGKPLDGELELDVTEGDTVLFPEKCAFVNEIEGTEYYVLDQLYLDAKKECTSQEQ